MSDTTCTATCQANGRRCTGNHGPQGQHDFIGEPHAQAGALERQALANVLEAIEDASAELAEATQDAIDKYLASTDRAPAWNEIERFDQLRTALERATSAANAILA